jgi:hypothetical protein
MRTALIVTAAAGALALSQGAVVLTALGGSGKPAAVSGSSPETSFTSREGAIVEERITWTLSNARVVRKGRTAAIREGILLNGYTVEADAIAMDQGMLMPEGTFRLVLAGFKPDWDIVGKRGETTWHVRGTWTITDKRIGRTSETRRKYGVLNGDLVADLSFNPARKPGEVGALIRLPVPAGDGRWTTGEGSFFGNERFEGTLSMTFRRNLDPQALSGRS